jgi:hypothetical protein
MTRSKIRWVLVGSISSALLVSIFLFIWLPLSQPDGDFHISLVSITNDPVQGYSAIFSITNVCSSTISYLVCSPQIKTNSSWASIQMPRHGAGMVLSPHVGSTFTVAAPSIWYVWRVPIIIGELPGGLPFFRAQMKTNIRRNWLLLKQGRSPRFFSNPNFPVYTFFSPEVTR